MRKSGESIAKPAATRARRSTVQSAGVATTVLKALAHLGGAASVTALAAHLQESPAKVHRYLASLVEADLVLQEKATARYVLGPESIAIGLAAMRQSQVLTLAAVELETLAESHRLSCFVAVLGNMGPTIVRWSEPTDPVTVNVRVGSVLPVLWSATGRAFGAFSDRVWLRQRIRSELNDATAEQRQQLPDEHAVDTLFAQVRACGCASIRDVLLSGVSAVAAPVFDVNGKVAAVLTALGPSGRFDPRPDGETALLVRGAAGSISARLGHQPAG